MKQHIDFQHLEKTGFGYFGHLIRAFYSASIMMAGSLLGFIHCIFPFVFHESMTDISQKILKLHKKV